LTRLGRLGSEAVGEGLVLGDLFLLARDFTFFSVARLDLSGGEGRVVPRVEGDSLVVDIEDVGADVVEKTVVVRDNDRTPLVGGQEFLEPLVGSSRIRQPGSAARTWANRTRSLKPPERVESGFW